MKKRFIKGLSVATAVCLSVSVPISTMAKETSVTNEGYVAETDDKGISYEVTNSSEDTVKNNDKDINTDKGGVYANNHSTINQTGDVNAKGAGATAHNGSTVNVEGDITVGSTETQDYGTSSKGVGSGSGSSVNVDGDVYSEKEGIVAKNSDVEVTGKVTVEGGFQEDVVGVTANNSNITVDNGLEVRGCTDSYDGVIGISTWANNSSSEETESVNNITVTGDVNVSNKTDVVSYASGISTAHTYEGKQNITVNGNINSNAEGYSVEAIGIDAFTNEYTTTDIKVNGDITATAITHDLENDDPFVSGIDVFADQNSSVNITVTGDVSGTTNALSNEMVYGINVNGDKDSTVNITVKGDVSGSGYGARFSSDGDINIIVDGTVSGIDSAVAVQTYTKEDNHTGEIRTTGETGNANITVWQLKSDSNQLVKAVNIDRTNGHTLRTELKDKEEEILNNINYIIRTDEVSNGTITLSGTKLIGGYNTAHEAQEVIIKVETATGYQLDAVKNGTSTLTKNADGTYTLVVPRGGGVELSAVLSAIKKTNESSGSSDDSGNGSSNNASGIASGNSSNTVSMTSESGASVSVTTSEANGVQSTTATISLGDKTANVATSVTTANGMNTTLRFVSGDISGSTFAGVGTVSADGTTVTTITGETFAVTSAPVLVITGADGQSVGCFMDPETGAPIATGNTEVYYQLGADGQLHAHWVNPQGFFYTGTVEINGQSYTFNEEGEMIIA